MPGMLASGASLALATPSSSVARFTLPSAVHSLAVASLMSGLALSSPAGAAIIYSVGGQTTGTMSAVSGGTVTTTATGGNPSSVTVTPSGFANVLVGKSATGTVVIDNIIDTVVSGSARSVSFSFTSVTPNAGVSATITTGSSGILTAGTARTVTITATPTVRGSTLAGTFTVSGSSPGVAAGNVGKNTASDTTNVTVNVVGRSAVASQTSNVTVYVLPGASTSQVFTVQNIGDGTKAGTDTSTFKSELWGTTTVTSGTGWSGGVGLTFNATGTNLTDTGVSTDSRSTTFVYTGASTRGNSGTATITGAYTSGGTNNTGSTAVTVLTGVTVAPVASTTATPTGGTTYVLVGSGATVTGNLTVKNIGDGTLAGANLSGTLANTTATGFATTTAAGTVSLGDSNNAGPNGTSLSQTLTYTAEATRSGTVRTASSVVTFTNGNASGNNAAAASVAVTVSAQSVAPVASTTTVASFGDVRVGTSATTSLTVKNTGDGNLAGADNGTTVLTNLRGNVSLSGPGTFTGGGAVNLTDSTSQTYMFTYTPTARGAQSTTLTTAFNNGSSDGKNLASTASSSVTATAVGPDFDATVAGKNLSSGPIVNGGTILFGDAVGGLTLQDLLISNLSNDNASKTLTDLTLTNVTITGSTEFSFSLSGFDSGDTVGFGTSTKNAVLSNLVNGDGKGAIAIQFISKIGGSGSAQLRIETDEGAALGGAGAIYVYNLVWSVPEPGTIAIFGAGLLGLAISRQRRRGRAFAALTAPPEQDAPKGAN